MLVVSFLNIISDIYSFSNPPDHTHCETAILARVTEGNQAQAVGECFWGTDNVWGVTPHF